jgi:tetratricopeptide (TPR) repeat protein
VTTVSNADRAAPALGWPLTASDVVIRLLAAAVPLAFNPLGVLAFDPVKLTLTRLAALALLGLVVAALWSGGWSWSRAWLGRPLALATLALLSVAALSTAGSVLPLTSLLGSYDRLQGLATLLTLAIIAAAVARPRGDPKDNRQFVAGLADWLLAWSAPVGLYALLQHFQLDPLTWLDRTFGPASTAGSSTALAGYLAMLVPLTVARVTMALRPASAAAETPQTQRAVGLGLLLGIQITALLTTGVRGALFGCLSGLLVLATLLLRQRGAGRLTVWLLGLLVTALLAIGALNLAPEQLLRRASPYLERLGSIGLQDVTAHERLLVWRTALETWTGAGVRLLIGFGPETQAQVLEGRLPAELLNRLPDQRFDRVHNLLLDQLLTGGLLGLAALCGLFGTLIARGCRVTPASPLAAGLTGAIVAHGVESLFAFGSGTTLTVFWLIVGMLGAWDLPTGICQETRRPGGLARLRAAGLAVLVICGSVLALSPVLADLAYRRALAYHGGEDIRGETAWLARAAMLAPDRDLYPLAEALALSREAAVERSAARRAGLLSAAQMAVERALRLDPLDPFNALHAGEVLDLRAQAEENQATWHAADEAYALAAALSPQRAELQDTLGLALLRSGRSVEALASFQRGANLQGATAERTAWTGDALRALGQLVEARTQYLTALEMDHESAPALAGLAELELLAEDGQAALAAARLAARYESRVWRRQERLADIAAMQGERDEAVKAARAAARLAPSWEQERLRARVAELRART